MRTVLLCSEESVFNRRVLPAFLAFFSDLVGIVVIGDSRAIRWRRLRYEWRRSRWRLLDVVAFRLFYRLRGVEWNGKKLARRANSRLYERLRELRSRRP